MVWVLKGSCLDEGMLPSLPDKVIDCCIMDPPYDAQTHNKQRRGQTPDYSEPTRPNAEAAQFNRQRHLGFKPLAIDEMILVARQCERVVKRWTVTFCSIEMIALWKACFEAVGLEYVRTCIWHRKGGAPQFTGDRPGTSCEAIVVAHPRGRKKWNGKGTHGWYEFDFDPEDGLGDVVFEDAIVLNRGAEKIRVHSAQKPLKLMQKLVTLFSNEGELILDPYAGSGTTGVAALGLWRRFAGIEIDEQYATIANERITKAVAPERKAA